MSFYITLCSSASKGTYPANTHGFFKTSLHNAIKLNADYEVALLSFHHVGQNWCTIPQEIATLELKLDDQNIQTLSINTACSLALFGKNIANVINETVKETVLNVKYVEPMSNHFYVAFKFLSKKYQFRLNSELCHRLGYDSMPNKWFDGEKENWVGNTIEIGTKNVKSFWIHSDIIEEQFVGDTVANLLRIVPYNATEGTMHVDTFDPYYFPVTRRYMSTIEIRIMNGPHIVQFDHEVVLVLNFKPI